MGVVLERQAKDEGVEIRLNTTVTPEYVEKEGVDALILAVGSTPIVPPIPGIDGDNVIVVNEYYLNKNKVADSVVVLGGGLAGCECAIHLGMEGKKVELVEMRDTLAADCNIRQRPILMRKVAEFSTAHTEYIGQKKSAINGYFCRRFMDFRFKMQILNATQFIFYLFIQMPSYSSLSFYTHEITQRFDFGLKCVLVFFQVGTFLHRNRFACIKVQHYVIACAARIKTVLLQCLACPNLKMTSCLQLKELAVLAIGMKQHILQAFKTRCDKQRSF